jgi:hypothetical protein
MFDRLIRPALTPDEYVEPGWGRFLFASTTAAWILLVMVAWRNAGWIGLDRWLIPLTQGAGRAPATSQPTREQTAPG